MTFVRYITLLFLSWTSLYAQNHKEIGTLKIGCVFPLSGSMAPLGKEAQASIQIALEELKHHPRYQKVLPHIEVYFEDDQSLPSGAEKAAEKLIREQRVAILFGSIGELNSQAVAKVAQKSKTPAILPTSFAHNDNTPYIIGTRAAPSTQAAALAKHLKSQLKVSQATLLGPSASSTTADDFTKSFRLLGGRVTHLHGPDSHEVFTKEQAAQTAEAILQQHITAIVTEAPIQNIQPILEHLGEKAPLILSLSSQAPPNTHYKVLTATPFTHHDPRLQHFTKRFQELTQWKPQAASAMIYDAFLLSATLLTDTQTSRPDALRKTIQDVHHYQGLHGTALLRHGSLQRTSLVIEHTKDTSKLVYRHQPLAQPAA